MSAASIRKGFCRGTLMTSIASAVGLLLFSLAAAQEGPHAPASASTKAAVAKSVHGNPGPLVIYDTLSNFLAATADLGTPSFDDFESGGAKYLPSNQFAACIEPVSSHSNDACYRDGDLVPGISIASNNARGVIVMNPGIYGMASRAIAAWPYRLSSQSYTVVSFDDPPTAVAADVYGFAMGDGAVPVATAPVQIDVRIVAATNRALRAAIAARRFREDLYFRLSVFPITVPPLRERPGDIPLLARYFVERFCRDLKKRALALSPGAIEHLQAYRWPGNVRELQNCIERAVILAESEAIQPRHLNLSFAAPEPEPPASPWAQIDLTGNLADATRRVTFEVERIKIETALKEADNNKGRASELLQISYKMLLAKLREHRLE